MADLRSPHVLLVTSGEWADGEPGGGLLPPALAERGIAAQWACWDDPAVDWTAADLVAVRSTWDYIDRRSEFLAWARTVPRLLNSADVFAWNTDKRYLTDLAATGLPVVPTVPATTPEELSAALRSTLADAERAVVKPAVGAGGDGVRVCSSVEEADACWEGRPVVVQPLLESVSTFGEHSVFVLGGRAGLGVHKQPAGSEIRVHEHFGGRTVAAELSAEERGLALHAVGAAEAALGERIDYARVDLMQDADGGLVVGELEVTEPGLYLDVLPGNAEAFAQLVRDLLDR